MQALLARNLIKKLENQPIFVVGTGRSGTSVLLQALGAHPLIFAARGEAPLISFAGQYMASFESTDKVVHSYLGESIKVPRRSVYSALKRLNFEVAYGPVYGLRRVVKKLIQRKGAFFKQQYWAAKIFSDEESCRGLRQLYPEAKFIYIVRDGLSVVQSRMKFAGFKHDSFPEHCRNWQNDEDKYAYLETADFAVHRYYEQLLDDPDQFFQTIYQQLGIPPDSAPTNYVKQNLIHPLDERDKKGVDARDILKSRPSPYTNWTDEQKQTFIDICSPGMQKHRYEIPFA